MADKEWCPGCDSYSSSVLAGLRDEGKCPFCGLPAEVILTVNAAKEQHLNEELTQKYLDAQKEIASLKKIMSVDRAFVTRVKHAVASHTEGMETE